MFTDQEFMRAEMDYRRERIQRYFKGANFKRAQRARRYHVRRPRNPFKHPRDTQVVAGGTVLPV